MGIEYYLVKPEKKEIFYLGKHFICPECITEYKYKSNPDFIDCEDYMEFFWDILQENWEYFENCDITLSEVSEIISKIHEWCRYSKIYCDNDCSDNAKNWLTWKETGDITKILEDIHEKDENNFGK